MPSDEGVVPFAFQVSQSILKRTGTYGFFIGSSTTTRSVAMGPRNSEISHQLSPLLPLACAKPALMSDRVNHPTAYSPVFEFMFSVVVFLSSLLAQAGEHVDYKGP
jgi:hypothetical protein